MTNPLIYHKQGWIEVICGCMFSGKTEELIRRVRTALIAKQKVQLFNSTIDDRYGINSITSHNQNKVAATCVRHSSEILPLIEKNTHVVAIDEINFFDKGIVEVCEELARRGKRVIVAGLDTDYRAEPFEVTAALLAKAEFVTKNLAVCTKCGNPASFTQRTSKDTKRIVVGTTDSYQARCRRCFRKPRMKASK
ncbi:MAG: thymidine kinase [Elusimicrobiaceae bacterium]|nr:thymidine kinase [Elusimicrobiaceae bacterium]